jgi:mono/diheme cytochrome c family protein
MYCVAGVSSLAIAGAATEGQSANVEPLYQVVDGKVDASTYLGWRVFHSACYSCHGVDATGTTVAPDLVERVKTMDARDFTAAVLTRYRITLGYDAAAADNNTALRQQFIDLVLKHERGDLIMPEWGRDPNVQPHVLDIYTYLRARSDGALGPGRPQKIAD